MVSFNIDVVVNPAQAQQGSKSIEAQLERLNKTAEKTRATTARIGRRVRAQGLRKVNKNLKETKNRASAAKAALTGLFGGIAFGVVAKQLIDIADTFTNYQNRLKLVTEDTKELGFVTERLFEIADNTRSSYAATAELYARVGLATKELGRSTVELLQFTESLNKAVILSGASAQEAKAGIIQLSQGLASGALRGDELRSVLEQLPKVADVIAKSLKVTRGELRKMGEQGKISANTILNAFRAARVEIAEEFAKTVPTISQSFQILNNKLTKFVGEMDKAQGLSRVFSQVLIIVANNLLAIVPVAAGVATFIALVFGAALLQVAGGFAALKVAALGPLGLIAAGVGIVIASISLMTAAINEYQEAWDNAALDRSTLTDFGVIGKRVGSATKQLVILREILKNTGSKAAADEIKNVEIRLKALNEELKESAKSFRLSEEARTAQSQTFKDFNRDLKNEAILLGLSGKARESRAKIIKLENKLGKETLKLSGPQKKKIEAEIASNQALKARSKVLEEIKGPERDAAERSKILKDLLDSQTISQLEFNAAVAKGGKGEFKIPEFKFGGSQGFEALDERLKAMRERFKNLGLDGTSALNSLGDALAKGVKGFGSLADQVKFLDEQFKLNKISIGEYDAALDSLLGKTIDQQVKDDIAELETLWNKGRISLQAYIDGVRSLGPTADKSALTMSNGFKLAFDKIKEEAEDLAAVGEKIVNVFADQAVDAITKFAETGKFAFKEFAAAILKDIARIIIRLLVVKALNSLGLGSAAAPVVQAGVDAAATNQNRQDGGTVQPGRAFVVGENGPEVFKPDRTGTIIPNAKDQKQVAPEVNVGITNVQDPNDLPAALNSGEFDQIIVNVISRQKDAVRQVVQK